MEYGGLYLVIAYSGSVANLDARDILDQRETFKEITLAEFDDGSSFPKFAGYSPAKAKAREYINKLAEKLGAVEN